jgi:hypothetical protein
MKKNYFNQISNFRSDKKLFACFLYPQKRKFITLARTNCRSIEFM